MRANHRRHRRPDPLASKDAVNHVLQTLRLTLPEIAPHSKTHLISMLQAARKMETRPATDTRRGRPAKYAREELLKVASQLAVNLSRETSISVRSFASHYLPILDFPDDVLAALDSNQINLFEAHQLARLSAARMKCSAHEAIALRKSVLQSHLMAQGAGSSLRIRVKEILGESDVHPPLDVERIGIEKADELLQIDPYDSRFLFYGELRRIARSIRGVESEDLDTDILGKLMPAIDQLSAVLFSIEQKRMKRRQQQQQ